MDTGTHAEEPWDKLERKQAGERLKAMSGMWQVLTSLSSLLNRTSVEGIDRGLDHALRILGSHGNEDRCMLFLLSEDKRLLSRTHTWSAEGIDPCPLYLQSISFDQSPGLKACLEGLKPVHAPRADGQSSEGKALQDFLRGRGVQSVLLVPLAHSGEPAGCLVAESTRRHKSWDVESIALFMAASEIISSACMRKRTEGELASCLEMLGSLSSDLTIAEDRERRRIASDLHDRVGHVLAVATMKLKALEKKGPPDFRESVHGVTDLVEELIRETQALTFSISPPVLYDFGLEAAVEWLVEDTKRQHGLDITFMCSIGNEPIDYPSMVLAYQVVRELLFNIVKHAGAQQAFISISTKKGKLYTVLEDDGRGFPAQEEKTPEEGKGGFGLFNIREKLAFQGGTLLVEPHPKRGTRVTMVSPMAGGRPAPDR